MRPPCTIRNHSDWPPNYVEVWKWRQQQLLKIKEDPDLAAGALAYYSKRPVEWINHWVDTYDPRNAGTGIPARIPLVMFERQEDLIRFLQACLAGQEAGLVEKSRDMGATWVCAAFSLWLWLFVRGASIGWGSRKEQLVDKLGDPDSIFEKIRMILYGLPRFFLPSGFSEREHSHYMRLINPDGGATITGEAGDNIGRGGRKLLYFKDESAHYERPEKIEAALADTTRVQIDISSVCGVGNVFYRRRESGVEWFGGDAVKGRTQVLILDWRDHPAKDQAWYDARKAKAESEGLLHLFAQEVDRNYAAAVDGIVIPHEWIKSAIDAHKKLKIEPTGPKVGGLDVADEGGDLNALAIRQSFMLQFSEAWGEGDVGQTARRAIGSCNDEGCKELQYDSIGVGAGVKSEHNRLKGDAVLVKGFRMLPWNAAANPERPDEHVEPGDEDSPLNKDFYHNLKAQAWWELRRRFERTHRAVTEGIVFDCDLLISLPGDLKNIRQIEKELGQPTITRSTGSMKLMINKKPSGAKSPNRGDSIAIAYFPVGLDKYTLENL